MTEKDAIVSRLQQVHGLVSLQDVASALTAVANAGTALLQGRVDLEKVRATREVALAQIEGRHELYRQVFERIFAERREAIGKYFELLDEGMARDKDELVVEALRELGRVVAKSPFSDLKALSDAIDSGEGVEL